MPDITPISFVLDPELDFVEEVLPPTPRLGQPYSVIGYVGGGFTSETSEGRSANCYYAVDQAIGLGLRHMGAEFHWPAVATLSVHPDAGKMWNAFYNRQALNFFSNFDQIRQKPVYASSSAKIVFHETGHGVLDSIRPDLWGYTNFEVWAFHEAFGDVMAFLCTMDHISALASQDTRIATYMGLEFGNGIWQAPLGTQRPLRNMADRFDYRDPRTLPKRGSNMELISEPHSFSRVFSCAVYDLYLQIRDVLAMQGGDPIKAAIEAVETVGRYFIVGSSLAAVNENFYDSVAKAMMFVDFREGKKHLSLMNDVFAGHGILKPQVQAMTNLDMPQGIHVTKVEKYIVLADESIVSSQVVNPLHAVKVKVSCDSYHIIASQSSNSGVSDHQAVVEDVALCLDYLHCKGKVNKEDSPFIVQDNTLVRQQFACGFDR